MPHWIGLALAAIAPTLALSQPPPATWAITAVHGGPIAGVTDAAPSTLTSTQVESLVLLGRVWGFVKYHDPRVTSGDLDWDAELRHAIPTVLAAPNAGAARDSIDRWLAAVGDPAPCAACAHVTDAPYLRPDVDWIRDARLLGSALSARLTRIYVNRSVAPAQRYVRLMPGVANPDFTGEAAYADDPLPPPDLRLLTLFRFWNILEYWFPYRNLMEPDRVALLREFVPELWNATDAARYTGVVMRLVARAHDTHANLWSSMWYQPPVGTARVPVTVRYIEGRFVVTDVAHPSAGPATDLRPGDVVVRIDGAPVDSLARAWAPYFGASNDAARNRDIARALLKGPPGPVELEIERADARSILQTARVPLSLLDRSADLTDDLPGDTFQMLTDGRDSVAYLKLSSITTAAIPGYLQRAAAGAHVLIIDIRNYPSAFVVFALGGYLASEPRTFARFTVGDAANPGTFAMTPPLSITPAPGPHFPGRVVILADELTQSNAEYTAMAFRSAPGVRVVGSTTAGADGNASRIPLPGGLQAMISGIGVFYPDGRPTQQVGIVPDVEAHPTIAGIRAGRDEVLEAAASLALDHAFKLRPPNVFVRTRIAARLRPPAQRTNVLVAVDSPATSAREHIQEFVPRLFEEAIDDSLGREKLERRSEEGAPGYCPCHRNGGTSEDGLAVEPYGPVERPHVRNVEERFRNRLLPQPTPSSTAGIVADLSAKT